MRTFLYRHFDAAGNLLYVGISNHVGKRTDEHSKHSAWFEKIAKIDVSQFESRELAIQAERAAIMAENPTFNVMHKPKLKALPPIKVTPIDVSRENITRSIAMQPLYDAHSAARVLTISAPMVRAEIARGNLGSFDIPAPKSGKPQVYITGWQLIDWLTERDARPSKTR